MSVLLNSKDFLIVFERAIDICSEYFNVSRSSILSKDSKRVITDIKKLIVYKFYNLKRHSKDNLVNLISEQFNCRHSNVVYWYNKAKELYSSDSDFRESYTLFSKKLDDYIKNSKIS